VGTRHHSIEITGTPLDERMAGETRPRLAGQTRPPAGSTRPAFDIASKSIWSSDLVLRIPRRGRASHTRQWHADRMTFSTSLFD
jgi:hypothetical protein